MTLARVTRGSPLGITASTFNAIAAAANDFQAREAEKLQATPASALTTTRSILVKNDTGADQNRYSVLGLGAATVTPGGDDDDVFLDRVVVSGVVPDYALHRGRFAILLEPASAGAVVSAAVEGLVQVQVNDVGQGGLKTAEIVHGSTTHLELIGYGSAAVIYRPGGPGAEWSIVKFGTAPSIFTVELQASGGAQGTETTPATWSYNVLDLGSRVLLSNIDPTVAPHRARRPDWGAVNQATAGLASIIAGAVTVIDTNEVWQPDLKYAEIQDHENRIYALEHP